MLDSLPSASSHIRDGLVRALAVTAPERLGRYPELPTMREGGVELVSAAWFGLSGPAGLPPAVTARLAAAVAEVLEDPATIARFEELLGAPPPRSTPEAYTRFVEAELAAFAPIVRAARIEL
jgi:tripartite-type tricarboxylate transporter receptor subunit TctC